MYKSSQKRKSEEKTERQEGVREKKKEIGRGEDSEEEVGREMEEKREGKVMGVRGGRREKQVNNNLTSHHKLKKLAKCN